MRRRKFLMTSSGVLGCGLLGVSNNINALLRCAPFDHMGFQRCEAGIDSNIANVVAASTGGQHMSQWCWAACIEMIFRYYGFNISQSEIVQQTWGHIVNLPGHPYQIIASLNRPWQDAYGRNFFVSGDTFSASPITAAQDLSQNMPLIIGTMGHAMVLTSLTYIRDIHGNGDVLEAVVRDPWPGRGRRILSAQEWYSTSFLIRIRVS